MDKIKILFLAANPDDTVNLNLAREFREIDQALRQTEYREYFDLKIHGAVRARDLPSLLLRHKPHVVHFSGHGTPSSEIILSDDNGYSNPISAQELRNLFGLLGCNIRCVVLNACHSEGQASSIADEIDCIIGMSDAIANQSAIHFAAGFYEALGYGRDVKTAFDLGQLNIDILDLAGEHVPKLIAKRVDPSQVFLYQEKGENEGSDEEQNERTKSLQTSVPSIPLIDRGRAELNNSSIPNTQYATVPADALEGQLQVIEPAIADDQCKITLESWLEDNWKNEWPEAIDSNAMLQNMQKYYILLLKYDVNASATWTCKVEQNLGTTVKACTQCKGTGTQISSLVGHCEHCHGTGQKEMQNSTVESKQGQCRIHSNDDVIVNVRQELLHTPALDLRTVHMGRPTSNLANLQILSPQFTSQLDIQGILDETIHTKLSEEGRKQAKRLGAIRNCAIDDICQTVEATWLLYPVYIGSYSDGVNNRRIQIDGLTGRIDLDLPQKIEDKVARRQGYFAIGQVIFVILLISMLLIFLLTR